MTRKIAIIGTAPSSRLAAPYDIPEWEIWTLGKNVELGKRIDRLFELHTQHVLETAGEWEALFPYLKHYDDKVILGYPHPFLPNAKLYPVDEILSSFPRYFTSSLAWILALAIKEKPDTIGIWGIDMIDSLEYGKQRSCFEYLLGMAQGMGINIVKADECPLLRADSLYAFEHAELSAGINIMRGELKKFIKEEDDILRKADRKKAYYEGQIDMLTTICHRYG